MCIRLGGAKHLWLVHGATQLPDSQTSRSTLCGYLHLIPASSEIEFIVYRQAVKGDGIVGVARCTPGGREKREVGGWRRTFCVQSCETTQGHVQEPSQHRRRILSMPPLDRLATKALWFDSSQRPRSFLTFARRSMTDPPSPAHWLPGCFIFMPRSVSAGINKDEICPGYPWNTLPIRDRSVSFLLTGRGTYRGTSYRSGAWETLYTSKEIDPWRASNPNMRFWCLVNYALLSFERNIAQFCQWIMSWNYCLLWTFYSIFIVYYFTVGWRPTYN